MRSMLRLAGMAGLVFGLAHVALAQDAAAPRLVLSAESWDFGKVWQTERPTFTLTVKNEGTADLQITKVTTSCGCTVAQSDQQVVSPGKSTNINVRYDTEGKQADVTSKVIIKSNDPVRPEVEFNIKGYVKRAINKTPLGGLVIRTLDTKAGQSGTVRLENQMPEPMKLELQSNSLREMDVEIKEITPGVVYDVIGRTNGEMKPGITRGALTFSTGLQREPKFDVFVRIQIYSNVDPVPAAIFLAEDKPIQRTVSLQYYGPEGVRKFSVTGAECKNKDIKVSFNPPRPAEDWMTKMIPPITAVVDAQLTLPPANQLPPEGALIVFTTTDPQCPKVEVLITTDKPAFDLRMYGPPVQGAVATPAP